MRYYRKMEGERIYLSPMNPEDYDQYAQWINDLTISLRLGSASQNICVTKEKDMIENLAKDGHNYAIIRKDSECLIGNCSLFNLNPVHGTAELGIFIGDEKNKNLGYGTEAIQLLLAYGFKILNLHNIMLRVFGFNQNAQKAYEKAGFKLFGTRTAAYRANHIWYDEFYYQILAEDFQSDYLDEKLPGKR